MPEPLGGFAYTWPFWAGGLLAYLVGSIPFGLLLTRRAGLGDVRKIGSGNIGATNVLRTGHKGLAAATLLLDAAKGAVPVLIAARFGPDMAIIAGGCAVVGHIFPVWLKFLGGKGMATALGAFFALSWPLGAAVLATWIAVGLITRYSSIASLVTIWLSPFYAWWLVGTQTAELAGGLAVLVLIRHYGNIRRLLRGEEPRIVLGRH